MNAQKEPKKLVRYMDDMGVFKKKVVIYTDGACSGNPGSGGWASILLYDQHEKEISGYDCNTTNNRMELKAAIEALKCLKNPCEIEIYSDSAYLINAFEKRWLKGWKSNGWRTSNKEEVKNIDLWKELDRYDCIHNIRWIKVKGHSGNEYNNRCDELATDEIKKYK